MEWYEPGTHEYKWPEEEMTGDEKAVAEQLLDQEASVPATSAEGDATTKVPEASSTKRKSPPPADEVKDDSAEAAKKQKVSETEAAPAAPEPTAPEPATTEVPAVPAEDPKPQPPAVKIKMTVTSGFYVRSLAHDLGKAVGSCALMSELVRSRQGDYELSPDRVLEYQDLDAGEEVWGPKVEKFLTEWEEKRAAKAEAEAAQ